MYQLFVLRVKPLDEKKSRRDEVYYNRRSPFVSNPMKDQSECYYEGFIFKKEHYTESPDSCEMSPAPDRITPVQGMADESYSLLPEQDYQSSRFA